MTNEPYADQISAATGGARETAAPEIRGPTDSTSVVIDSPDIRRGKFRSFAHRDTLHIFALGIPSVLSTTIHGRNRTLPSPASH